MSITTASFVPGPHPGPQLDCAGTSFADLGVADDVVALLARTGITTPFPIQAATIPAGLAGRDIAGRAPTGSGKTLAFGLPLCERVERGRPARPRALVLAPTRELAAQIERELAPIAALRRRKVASFYGGVGFGAQLAALRKGVDIVVACPGRLGDLIEKRCLFLHDVDIVVVDEADRMADMGFLPEVRRILDQVSPQRQTILFSATLDGDVDVLVRNYQRDPLRHEVAEDEDGDLRQHLFWKAERGDRLTLTTDVIAAVDSTVVFCRTKRGADRLAQQLGRNGLRVAAIHGDRSQSQREAALAAFSAGRVRALVATDVAARGIHVDDVGCVLHYDMPEDEKAYVHRSGRTGRAGAGGAVVSLVLPDQLNDVRDMQRRLGFAATISAADVRALDGSAARGTSARREWNPETDAPAGASGRPPRKRSGARRPAQGAAAAPRNGNGNGARSGNTQRNGAPGTGTRNGNGSRSGNGTGNGHPQAARAGQTQRAKQGGGSAGTDRARSGSREQTPRTGTSNSPRPASAGAPSEHTSRRAGADAPAPRVGRLERLRRSVGGRKKY